MPRCSKCEINIEEDANFCPECGQPFVAAGESAMPDDHGKKQPENKYFAIGLVVVAVMILFVLVVALSSPSSVIDLSSIKVPEDYTTIQEAIDAAEDGDVIVVEPGIYRENIDFKGKNINLRSSDPGNPEVVEETIIDGGGNASVVTFSSGEGEEAVLAGFTLTGGKGNLVDLELELELFRENGFEEVLSAAGGAIFIANGSSPVIEKNIITENMAEMGGGIYVVDDASPLISENVISMNNAEVGTAEAGVLVVTTITHYGTGGAEQVELIKGAGGGIYVTNNASPSIEGNSITSNIASIGGGGLYVYEASPIVNNNNFEDNEAEDDGGAIFVGDDSPLSFTSPDDNRYSNNKPDDVYKK